eukprot:FR736476.1.p1 GENE.FR736476.1~~FR736476.1.p1  ORF type:complete len:106 (+),score=11.59 FR736476.1:239-556(+)
MTDEELQEMINEADRDGDGEINEDEFLRIVTKTSLYYTVVFQNSTCRCAVLRRRLELSTRVGGTTLQRTVLVNLGGIALTRTLPRVRFEFCLEGALTWVCRVRQK